MQFFDFLQGGSDTPLTPNHLAGLFHSGCISRHTGCTSGEPGQTIEYLSPPSKYQTAGQVTRRSAMASRQPFHLSLPTAIPLVLVGAIASVIIGCFFFSPQPSMASPTLISIASPAVSSSSVPGRKQTKKNTAQRRSSSSGNGALVVLVPAAQTNPQFAIRLAESKRLEEQARRDQTVFEEDR